MASLLVLGMARKSSGGRSIRKNVEQQAVGNRFDADPVRLFGLKRLSKDLSNLIRLTTNDR